MLNNEIFINIIILLLFAFLLYLVLIRPQIKRLEIHNKMLKNLKKGDTILTMGGIIGKIVDFEGENILIIEVSKGNNIKIFRKMIETIYHQ